MTVMQKFGSGDVAQPDPQDPQGVPVSDPQAPTFQHQGAAESTGEPTDEQRQRELDEENRAADSDTQEG